jgi:tRNA nucleotidyltransferase (CCA-adding enzyme)
MENNLRRLMLDPNLLPLNKQTLLSNIAAQAAILNMPCYLVGGFARDLLLQKPVNDLDVIVEGNAIELGDELVKKYGGKLTAHRKFGTAVWFLPSDDLETSDTSQTLDLITARSETYEHAGALPTIKLSTIEDDICRRDFTINAMALCLDAGQFGELIDLLDGQNDLAQGAIRILHPRSFIDDPTRILRAVRYEQRYGFKIEPDTLKLINQESFDVLSKLSGERIRHEFDLIFEEKNAALMLSRLKDLDVLNIFNLPDFNGKYSGLLDSEPPVEFDIFADRVLLGYLLWFMDSSKDLIHFLSKRFDFTLELTAAALSAIQLKKDLPLFKDAKPSAWTFHLERFPLLSIYTLWLVTNESALSEFLVKWRHVKSNITGDDLKARRIPQGPKYKEILSKLRAAWLDGDVDSAAQELSLFETWIK